MRFSDLPPLERPREKALHYGVDTLSNHELLALLIGSGYTDTSASDVAYQLLSESGGLLNLLNKTIYDLLKIKGIGEGKALRLLSCFELVKRIDISHNKPDFLPSTIDLYQKYESKFSQIQKEHVYLIILDKFLQILEDGRMTDGQGNTVYFSECIIIFTSKIHH